MALFSSDMSSGEIDLALQKITLLYKQLMKKYGSSYLDYNGFRERYLHALKNRMNMAHFFKVEMEELQQQEFKIKELKDRHLNNGPKERGVLDKTVDELIKQIDSYPEYPMNDKANLEIKRLIGMCHVLYPELMNIGVNVYVPVESTGIFHQACKMLDGVVHKPYSFAYTAYVEALDNDFIFTITIDGLGQKLIKEIATALQTILVILRESDPIKVGHLVEYIEKAIIDFRLDIFKGMV